MEPEDKERRRMLVLPFADLIIFKNIEVWTDVQGYLMGVYQTRKPIGPHWKVG